MGRKFRVLCVFVLAAGFAATAEVRLKVRTLSSAADLHRAPLLRKTPHRNHFVAEMEAFPSPRAIQEWRRRGIRVTGYIPPRR